MKKIIIILLVLLNMTLLYAQENELNYLEDDYTFTNPFRIYKTDKYYTGWQDPRAFIGRILFAKNFNMEKNLSLIAPNANWDFNLYQYILRGVWQAR
ncbi:hypothetical protein [uncultured Brachyspira sp.]|uniref:hypothetical protein n=1 Tax=uncultured Brachyspira sp. TaxID=221953 RepID=UPI0025D36840|nr:hypothetical protein [uncultured Brachyspira sp.]